MAAMTLLHQAADFKKMDTRVLERNIDRGVVQPKEVEKAVKDLADDSSNAEYTSIDALAGDESKSARS
jgi:hypothetical protein